MSRPELHVVVPGSIAQRTGGSIYDRRIVQGLGRRGWSVVVHEVAVGVADAVAAGPSVETGPAGAGRVDARPGGTLPVEAPPSETVVAEGGRGPGLGDALARLPNGARVVVDGLAMAGSPEVVGVHGSRLRLLALIHLVAGDEPGIGPAERDRRWRLESDTLGACAGVIATSGHTAARLRDLGVDSARILVVPPGTDRAGLATGPGEGAPPQLLCVAAVTPGKGQEVLVRALARLADVPWRAICAGSLTRDPAFADRVRALTDELRLADRVTFPGECDRDTVDALYRTSSVFVLPSAYEAYGMVLGEAMAWGLPVVSTTGGAIPETVPAAAGLLVAPGDEAALADALRWLLADGEEEAGRARERRASLGSAGRRHASALPDWDTTVEAFGEAVSALA